MQLLSWPEIHGAVTHFPIAMLTTAIVFDLAGFILKREDLRKVGFWMLVIAVLGAVGALISGWINGDVWFPTPTKPPIFYQHRTSAFVTSSVALLFLLWRIAKKDSFTGAPLYVSLAVGIWLAVGAGFVGYLGGKMALPDTSAPASPATAPPAPETRPEKGQPNPGATAAATSGDVKLISLGQQAFSGTRTGCVNCHSMNGSGGHMAPDLTHEGSRHPDISWQIAHMKNPQAVTRGSQMPPYAGTDDATLKAIAAYLVSKK